MKKILTLSVSVIFLLSFSKKEVAYSVDKSASTVHWLGKKTTGQHEGEIKLQSGAINLDGSTPTTGEFVIDMTTITVSDIKDPDDNKDLVGHLKKDEFFGVDKFPTATLTIKKFEKIANPKGNDANYKATADLTIKGTKNEIQFPAQITMVGGALKASANITIDRTKWNIVYKSKTIFSTLGDKFIYDDVNFTVNLVMQARK